jgi:hypothetical protein
MSQIAYRSTAVCYFPRDVLVTSVIGLAFLPRRSFSQWLLPYNRSSYSLLKAAIPERFPNKVTAGPRVPPSSSFYRVAGKFPRVAVTHIFLALKLYAVSFSAWVGADSSIISWHRFFESSRKTQPLASRSPVRRVVELPHKMSPCSKDKAAAKALVSYVIVAFKSRPTSLLERLFFRGFAYNIVLASLPTTVYLAR